MQLLSVLYVEEFNSNWFKTYLFEFDLQKVHMTISMHLVTYL